MEAKLNVLGETLALLIGRANVTALNFVNGCMA